MNWIKKTWKGTQATPKVVREFGFILAGFFLLFPLFANLLGMWLARKSFHYWFGWPFLSIAALAINIFLSRFMSLIYRVAMFVARMISEVIMRVLLGILFYLVLSPMGVTMRALGKDLLDEKIDRTSITYWKKRTTRPAREQYERLF